MESWYAIKTKPKREGFAAASLQGAGLEILCPMICLYEKLFGNNFWVDRPLFPCYIFSKFDIFVSYRRVKYAGGVREVVGFGQGPVPVDEQIITALKDCLNKDGFLEITRMFAQGDRVRIAEGPLEGLIGTLEQQVSSSERVAVLLSAIHYQARILIDSVRLERLGRSRSAATRQQGRAIS